MARASGLPSTTARAVAPTAPSRWRVSAIRFNTKTTKDTEVVRLGAFVIFVSLAVLVSKNHACSESYAAGGNASILRVGASDRFRMRFSSSTFARWPERPMSPAARASASPARPSQTRTKASSSAVSTTST